ncbi:hypothetical protein [Microbacterium sp. PA5]|uniref:hypothetical protein n=1 Tax=Microbacterium sp. PA5 TaxID=3416654 RepID=UPI003CF2DDE5
MPSPPAPLPPELGRTFHYGEARARGASPRRLRAGDLAAPHRGVRVRVAEVGREPDDTDRASRIGHAVRRRAEAYDVVRHPDAFFVGRTALALYALPLERLPGEQLSGDLLLSGGAALDVGVFAPQRAPRARGVRGVQVRPALATLRSVGGFPVTSPASTWALLAGELDATGLTRLGDALVRIPRDERGRLLPDHRLATMEQLRAAADVPRRRGRPALYAALAQIRVGSASPLETNWRLAADAEGMPEFALDVEIRDARGALLGIADAAHHGYRVAVEIEGDHHRTDRAQWSRDIEKHAAYVAAGWEPVRLTAAHIRSGRATILLGDALRRRGWIG